LATRELFVEGTRIARGLPKTDDLIAARDLAVPLALIPSAYAVLLVTNFHALACIVAVLMISKAQYALLLIGHEAVHYSTFTNKRLNDFVGSYLCFGPVGVGFNIARAAHLDHHRFLLTEKDVKLDQQLAEPTRRNLIRHLLRPLFGYYLFKGGLRLLGFTIETRVKPTYTVTPSQRRADLTAIGVSSLVLFAVLTAFDWRLYPLFWVAPLFTVTAFLHNARAMLDHVRMPEEPEDLLYSYKVRWYDRMLFGTLSYRHAEHHLWPHVPHHQLPQLEPVARRMPNVVYRPSSFRCMLDYYKALPRT
jgi:fatty acid desaturase